MATVTERLRLRQHRSTFVAAIAVVAFVVYVVQESWAGREVNGDSLLFFLIVGPEASAGLHVKILSRIARLVRRDTVRQQLLEATTADAFYNVLLDAEAR